MEIKEDYYACLGISPSATDKEIRLAYRQLARRFHPDLNRSPDADKKFKEIQEAYETLNDPAQRRKYDHWRAQQGLDRSSAISLRATVSHKTLQPLPEEQAYYVLLDIMPTTDLAVSRLPLNLCLVLDRSTSMQGLRLQKVKEAINQIIDKLQPQDALSLIAFSDRAEVLLPGQCNVDQAITKSIVSTIQAGGGTEILPGLKAGLKEIERNQSKTSVNQLILLTDGQTYGDEQECLEQAKWAGANQIHFSTIGIGSDWNEDLLDQMAALSDGTSIYIDSPKKLKSVFSETMRNLETIVARDLTMKINLHGNVRLYEVHQMIPHISRLEAGGNRIMLGSLSTNQNQTVLLEFRVKELLPGERRLMRIMVEGDMPGQAKHRPWEWLELSAHVGETANQALDIPSTITAGLSKLAIFKLQEKVTIDLEEGQVTKATERLKILATRLLDVGEARLANVALLEAGQLARTRVFSAKGRKRIRYGTRTLSTLPEQAPQLRAVPVA